MHRLRPRGTGEDFCAGIERAVALGWLWLHESETYLRFTDSGATLFHDLVFSKSSLRAEAFANVV